MRHVKFHILFFITILLISNCNVVREEPLPNIIFVLADDLRYGDIHAFNSEGKILTYNIDNLASEGMKFTDAHSSASVCTPTRYGILTGRYNWRSELKSGVLKRHDPSYIYRRHKVDIYEGGHRFPFIVKWPAKIRPGSVSQKTICTTYLLATCADITGTKLEDMEAEDSFSMLPLFSDPNSEDYQRETTVHHSINGSFAIRKDNWKLIFRPDSGGWSAPRPNSEGIGELSPYQLYDLQKDPHEQINLYEEHPTVTLELKKLMISIL